MKFFLIAFAVIAAVAADVSHLPSNEYLPPVQEAAPVAVPTNEYLPPVQAAPAPVEFAPAHELADDGYRYKTHRRVVYRRHRRDVSHLPSNEYLPPVQEAAPVAVPTNEYLPPVQEAAPIEAAPGHVLADDGYRYKTHRRVVYRRNRRDVSHLPSNEYLPPVQEAVPVEVAPVQDVYNVVEEAAPAHELANDGYRYKTAKRRVIRRRRDVSHLPSNEYLPPVQEAAPVDVAPVQEYAAVSVEQPAPAHELAEDGYRYKTVKRRVVRRRRDVSHLPSNEYLPPVQEATPVVEAPVVVNVQEEAVPAHELTDDGYRYKTHRRVVYRRNRRDVSHLPSNEYLPPVQEAVPVDVAPVQEVYNVVEEAAPAHELANDGYRYKTAKRRVIRRRRDVSHLPSNEYLPPVQEAVPVDVAPVQEVYNVVEEAAPAHELANDGYRYKTAKRRVIRRRRDVSHLPSNEYLPPVQEAAPVAVPTNEYLPPVQYNEPAPAHDLSADGYRYKTHRRVVYQSITFHWILSLLGNEHFKMKFFIVLCALVAAVSADVSHLPSNKYLPPTHSHAASAPAVSYSAAPASSSYHVEAASAPAASYSAPATQTYHAAASAPAVSYSAPASTVSYSAPAQTYHAAASAPAVSYSAPATSYTAPATQTFHTAASAPSISYSAPAQSYHAAASAPAVSYSAPATQSYETSSYESAASEPAHTFSATEGYRYKTAKRRVIRRRRRDVSHLPSNEYLPPHQGAASSPSVEYLPPAASAPVAHYESAPSYSVAASAPAISYSAPAQTYHTSASAPAVSYSAPSVSYSSPAQTYHTAASAPAVSYSSYNTAASEPAHTFSSSDGYRYKTHRRRVIRRHRRF
ncbi:uncharacterized protein ACRADG_003230 [Cochliomyia hominivorax]